MEEDYASATGLAHEFTRRVKQAVAHLQPVGHDGVYESLLPVLSSLSQFIT